MASVVSGTQALRLGSLNLGTEFTTSSMYTSDTGAYFLLPTAYTALSGSGFDPEGPGQVPTAGAISGWAKYSYDGTPHYTFSGLPDVPVAVWADAIDDNDTSGLLTAALAGNDRLTGGALADELFGFAGNDDLVGAAGNDTLRGDAGNDDLDGGAGSDTMTGGDGNDTYSVDNVGDRVTEVAGAGAGSDTVKSAIAYTLGANVENLELTGTATSGTGNAETNTLTGNAAANVLNGGAGVDNMVGGDGNDTYVVDAAGETITEAADAAAGTDTVQSSATHTLAVNVENLTLTGTAAIDGTGNGDANTLTGNAAANVLAGAAGTDTLRGEAGNDVLNGGADPDAMAGGAGDDFYVVEEIGDTVAEALSAGTDTVQSDVQFTLGANVENLTLTGSGDIDGFGNTLANILVGNTGANDLNGGGGADMMFGGGGDDGYVVDNAGDRVVEIDSGGRDTVTSTISHTLAAEVEDLILTPGTAAINGSGNAGSNALTGNAAANVLAGGAGDDTLDGGPGADAMAGGTENDTYVVDHVGDRVTEASDGGTADLVRSTLTHTLGANVENLTLTGDAAINGTGNALGNTITGNGAINVLSGGDGNDTLGGGGGNDTLIGGAGNEGILGGDGDDAVNGGTGNDIMGGDAGADTFLFAPGFGADEIIDWGAGDKISFDTDLGVANFAALDDNGSAALDEDDSHVSISAGDTVITFGTDVLTIDGITDLDTGDFVFVA